ncbi:hypothetical protein P171DRAFT_67692 [Karstenula rhodostoma CBS 690.94]|uniref:Uncharacterized protein n=1 Tax=Karstenula rhodostoma CBS 690.94 TaxID=1392251 RepID=A0A9P4PGF9_9PLEO|nr:hypothetical protein P171DRAFT_67692 [Karstenula rhodostoma CBS 690.94]
MVRELTKLSKAGETFRTVFLRVCLSVWFDVRTALHARTQLKIQTHDCTVRTELIRAAMVCGLWLLWHGVKRSVHCIARWTCMCEGPVLAGGVLSRTGAVASSAVDARRLRLEVEACRIGTTAPPEVGSKDGEMTPLGPDANRTNFGVTDSSRQVHEACVAKEDMRGWGEERAEGEGRERGSRPGGCWRICSRGWASSPGCRLYTLYPNSLCGLHFAIACPPTLRRDPADACHCIPNNLGACRCDVEKLCSSGGTVQY